MRKYSVYGPPRQWLIRLHRWSGLALLVMLTLAATTGIWLAYRVELDRWLNPELRRVEIKEHQTPLADVVATVERGFPGAAVSSIAFTEQAEDALLVYLKPAGREDRSAEAAALEANQVFVDPYDGRILGRRSTNRLSLSRAGMDGIVVKLHYSLLTGTTGSTIMGVCAVVWLLTSAIGMVMSWPTAWRSPKSWRPVLALRRKDGPYKLTYDLHRAAGVLLFPVMVIMAITSVYLNLPGLFKGAVEMIAPLTPSTPSGQAYRGAPRIGIDAAVQTAMDWLPGATVRSVGRDFRNGRYSVRLRLPSDVAWYGNNAIYVDMNDGEVVATRLAADRTLGDAIVDWQLPLHSGKAFGRAGQAAIVVVALSTLTIMAAGFYVWREKWMTRRQANARDAKSRPAVPMRTPAPEHASLSRN